MAISRGGIYSKRPAFRNLCGRCPVDSAPGFFSTCFLGEGFLFELNQPKKRCPFLPMATGHLSLKMAIGRQLGQSVSRCRGVPAASLLQLGPVEAETASVEVAQELREVRAFLVVVIALAALHLLRCTRLAIVWGTSRNMVRSGVDEQHAARA